MIRDGHLGYRGFLSLVIITTAGKIFNPSATILTNSAKESTWLLMLVSAAVSYGFMLLVLSFMKPHAGTGLLQVIEKRVGVWAAKAYGMIIFAGMTFNGFLNLRLLVDQTKVVTLPNTPLSVMLLCILILCIYLNYKGIECLGRLSSVLLPWLIGTLISLALLVYNLYDFTNLFPLFGPGLGVVITEGVKHGLYFGELMALPVLASLVRNQDEFEKGMKRGGFYAILFTILLMLIILLTMGSQPASNISFPFLDMARMIYINRFIHHLEGFYSAIWLLIALTQTAIDLYLSTFTYAEVFQIKQIRPLYLPLASLYFLLALSPAYFNQTLNWKDRYLIEWGGIGVYGSFILIFLLSILFTYRNNRRSQEDPPPKPQIS